jgi:hypothetical protein
MAAFPHVVLNPPFALWTLRVKVPRSRNGYTDESNQRTEQQGYR